MKRIALILPLLLVCAKAKAGADCSGDYRCGAERIIGVDDRSRPAVIQPQGTRLESPCDGTIDPSVSFKAEIHPVTCGEGAVAKDRLPKPVSKEIMDSWDQMSRSSDAQAQQKMQAIRQTEIGWSGEIEFPMWESWTYQQLIGDFNPRCGMEPWQTTCQMDREIEVEYYTDETDYDNCTNWEEDPEPSPSSYGGSSNPYGSELGSDSGSNSYESDFQDHVDDSSDRYPDSVSEKLIQRNPAGRHCTSYGTKRVRHTRWDQAEPLKYSCLKQRPKWCTWYEPRTISRSCPNHKANFSLKYKKDDKWQPGYAHPKDRARDYHDLLPNKFDLLPGESEIVYSYVNTGRSTTIHPTTVISSKWNEYSTTSAPAALECRFGMKPQIQFEVSTIGRIKNKSPNVLAIPRTSTGDPADPFGNQGKPQVSLPMSFELQDHSRSMMLQASMISRTFDRPQGAVERDKDGIFKKIKSNEKPANSLSMGFWVDTQFKLQLYRYDKRGKAVRMTPSTQFNINNVETFDDYITFHLEDGRLPENLYRATGPMQSMLGLVWNAFGVELSPGQKYALRLQTIQRGLPFYESGCAENVDVCEGEKANQKSFSEPIDVIFSASDDIKPGVIRRIKDWQEKWILF